MGMLWGAQIGAAIADEISSPSLPTPAPKLKLSPDPLVGVWKILGGVSLYLASNRVDKVSWGWIRTSGYGASIALGVAGLADLLRVNQTEET
jgi:hypothetical protein